MPENTPELDVEAIRARLDAADTAEWSTVTQTEGHIEPYHLIVVEGRHVVASVEPGDRAEAVLEFLGAAPTDLRRLLDENARLNAENDDMRKRVAFAAAVVSGDAAEMLAESLTKARAELDRVIREAAADKALIAKIGEPEEEWAIRVITEPGGTYWYHQEADGENPEQDLAITLEVLADGRDLAGNPVPHGPVSIVKRTVWSTEWETVETAPEMPRPPAVEAAPEVSPAGGSTGVPELEKAAQASEAWQVRITAPDGTGIVQPADSLASVHAAASKWRSDLADSEVSYCVDAEHRLVGPWELLPPLPVPGEEA